VEEAQKLLRPKRCPVAAEAVCCKVTGTPRQVNKTDGSTQVEKDTLKIRYVCSKETHRKLLNRGGPAAELASLSSCCRGP